MVLRSDAVEEPLFIPLSGSQDCRGLCDHPAPIEQGVPVGGVAIETFNRGFF